MRQRLLWSTIAAVSVALFLLGLPLGVAVESQLTRGAFDVLEADAEQARAVLDRQPTPRAAAAMLALLAEARGQRFKLLDPSGRVIVDTERSAADGPGVPPDVETAIRSGEPGYHRGDGVLSVAVPGNVGGSPRVLQVQTGDGELRAAIRRAWLGIGALGLVALAAAVLLALWQGHQLALPLEDLADSARRLGDGDFTARAPHSGLPEPDDVADALNTTASRLGTMLQRSRSFGADASHQLRTPLTALRLDLEALQRAGADAELVAAAMIESDRLETTIDELLTLAEPPAGEQLVDVTELAATRLGAWQALARARGRDVVLDAEPVPRVQSRAAALGQCLQVLLDNALTHGDGTITVSVRAVAGVGVRLCVADEGPGFPSGEAVSGATTGAASGEEDRGRGLPLARSLVEAEGGRLHVEHPERGAMVCLLIPGAGG